MSPDDSRPRLRECNCKGFLRPVPQNLKIHRLAVTKVDMVALFIQIRPRHENLNASRPRGIRSPSRAAFHPASLLAVCRKEHNFGSSSTWKPTHTDDDQMPRSKVPIHADRWTWGVTLIRSSNSQVPAETDQERDQQHRVSKATDGQCRHRCDCPTPRPHAAVHLDPTVRGGAEAKTVPAVQRQIGQTCSRTEELPLTL
jgi:hypothetical protein